MSADRSFLWHVFSQVTLICVLLACMFHWFPLQVWLTQHVHHDSRIWRSLGYCIPAMVVCGFVIFCEWCGRKR